MSSVRPLADHRHTAAAAFSLGGLLAGHTMLEVARDSMFLTRLGAEQLPLTYLIIAAVSVIGSQIDRRLLEQFHNRLPMITMLAAAGGAVVFYFFFGSRAAWVPHAFYVWGAMITTLAVAQLWRLLSEIFTLAEAKRVYPRIAALGSLGAMVGAAGAELALSFIDPRGLLWLGALVYVATALVPTRLLPRAPKQRSRPSLAPEARNVRRTQIRHYARRLLALVAITAVAATIVDYVFKATVDASVASADLGLLFSRFYFGLNLLSLLAQVLVAPRLFRYLGTSGGLVILPLLVAIGAGGMFIVGGIGAAVLLRAVDGGLRNSIHRSALELLYFPLSQNARHRYKALIDGLGQRGGQMLGSLVILFSIALGIGVRELVLVVLGLALAWVALSLSMRTHYIELFRTNLRLGAIQTRVEVPRLDLHSLESLIASLNSDRDEEVLSSLELLRDYDRVRLVPALLLYHPSATIVLRTLELLAASGRKDFLPIARRLREHDDPHVQAAAMRTVADVLSPEELRAELEREREHPTAASMAVLVASISRGLDDGSAQRELMRCAAEGDEELRIAIARAIRLRGDATLSDVLHALVPNAGPELLRELARAFGELRDVRAIEILMSWLIARGARSEARNALFTIGAPARAPLSAALADDHRPRALRGHIPSTIARFGDVRAAEVLFSRLEHERDGWVRYKILRALRTLRDVLPELRLEERRVIHARAALVRATQMLQKRLALVRSHREQPHLCSCGGELLEAVLVEKEAQAIDRAVRLVALGDAQGRANGLTRALTSPDRHLRAESGELLMDMAHPSLAPVLSALLDEAPDAERLSRALALLNQPTSAPGHTALLRELVDDESDAVRCIAAYHVGEIGLVEIADALVSARDRAQSGPLRDVITHALARLEDANTQVRNAE